MCDLGGMRCVLYVLCATDFVQDQEGLGHLSREDAWARMLADDDKLLQSILSEIPQWARGVRRKPMTEQQSELRHAPHAC